MPIELLVIAAGLSVWLATRIGVPIWARPRAVEPGPPMQALPGDEPPAIVALLTDRWEIGDRAVESTLLDLAARRYVELRQTGDDPMNTTVHARRKAADGLVGYERQVLERITALSRDGAVPVTALTFRDPDQASSWHTRFAGQVAEEARRRGLSRPRRRGVHVATVVVGCLAGAAGVATAFYLDAIDADPVRAAESPGSPGGNAFGIGIVVAASLALLSRLPKGETDTPEGRGVAARWLGLQRYLCRDTSFGDLPPASVAVWDRYLAYGDAVGATRVCHAVLDLGLSDGRRLWSRHGGAWRPVQVRYPRLWRRYGRETGDVAMRAAGLLVAGCLVTAFGVLALGGPPRDITRAATVVGPALLLLGAYPLVAMLVTLPNPVQITGEVLWLRKWRELQQEGDTPSIPFTHHLVVDDGRSDSTVAWALPSEDAGGVAVGDTVAITARRWTRRVTSIRVVETGSGREMAWAELEAYEAYEDARRPVDVEPPIVSEVVPTAMVSKLLGIEVRRKEPDGLLNGAVATFVDGQGKPALYLLVHSGLLAKGLMAARRRRTRLPGVGDRAYAGRNWVAGSRGDWAVALDTRRAGRAAGRAAHVRLLEEILARLPE